jgi:hypothetical protein
MREAIKNWNAAQPAPANAICDLLAEEIEAALARARTLDQAEEKIWHAHPVWFLKGNPIVGYSRSRNGSVRLMFWSGASFNEPQLEPGTGKFKDASIRYGAPDEVNRKDLKRWLSKARRIQWDYANIVKRKGRLEKIGAW